MIELTPALALLRTTLAAAEPGHTPNTSALQWTKFALSLHKQIPDRFRVSKGPDGIPEIADTRDCVDIRRLADGVTLYANGKAVLGGLPLTLAYSDPKILEAAVAFFRIQDAADKLYQAAAAAMAGPIQEITALLPAVKRKGNTVQRAVDTFRARVSKGFRESGSHGREPVL